LSGLTFRYRGSNAASAKSVSLSILEALRANLNPLTDWKILLSLSEP
jgi:hypothetical protein